MSHNETIADALATVLKHVDPKYREPISDILKNVVAAQYNRGYCDGLKSVSETLASA